MNNSNKKNTRKRNSGASKEVVGESRLANKVLRLRTEVHALVVKEQERISRSLVLDPSWNLEDIAHQAIITWLQEPDRLNRAFREKNDSFFEAERAKLK